MDEHRDLTLKRKQMQNELNKQEETEFMELWKEKMKQLEADEKMELDDIRKRNKNLQDYHRYQIENKKKKAEEEFLKDQENAYQTKLMLQNEQSEFLNYAENWVRDYYQDGKDIKPLILELKNYKKRLFYS